MADIAPPRLPGRVERGPNWSAVLGVTLVLVGAVLLLARGLGFDLERYGWPLWVMLPGAVLLAVGLVLGGGAGIGLIIPGSIILVAGLVLFFQNATDDWASWAYAWALIAPGGVGLGLFIAALRTRDPGLRRAGLAVAFIGIVIFVVGFVFFETVLHISGRDFGLAGQVALPGLLIALGVALLARSFSRGGSSPAPRA